MSVYSITDYLTSQPKETPRVIRFFSPLFLQSDGKFVSLVGTFSVKNGDVEGVLAEAVKMHGVAIRDNDTGVLNFIPWPCAVVEIRDLSEEECTAMTWEKEAKQTIERIFHEA